jgi:Rrf2 family nitric oxide-sensitive transcriptional repressor
MLLKISDASNLALHAMMVLSREPQGGQLSVADMARRLGASENHLAKVMQRLAKVGLVRSRRGPGGGFTLKKPSAQIKLIDIYTAIEGPLPRGGCLLDRPVCDGNCCLLGGLLGDLHERIAGHLERTTLDMMCPARAAAGRERRRSS